MSDKKYIIEYATFNDEGWNQYECCDTLEEARELACELRNETDGEFTIIGKRVKDIRIVTLVDDKTAIFKQGLTVKELVEWLQQIDPDKGIQARDNTGDWCTSIQLSELIKFVYIQSLPE